MIALNNRIKIIRADSAGACYGVMRALELAQNACQSCGNVCTLGEIIHNPIVVDNLEKSGVRVADSVDEASGTVILRSHGVKPEVESKLAESGCEIVDATCPHVKRAQKAAERMAKEGREVIVVGEAGHPEVESIVAYAKDRGAKVSIVANAGEIESLSQKVGIVSQTTQKVKNFEEVCEVARAKSCDVDVKDTICLATEERQSAARKMAKKCNIVIVLGGKNSSNTTRLYEICAEACKNTYHIEKPIELPLEEMSSIIDATDGEFLIGLTAGASTPIDHIDALEKFLEDNL